MGLMLAVLSATGACSFIQKVMPTNLKHATTIGIGLFQAFIGFRMTNVVVGDPETLVALGDLLSIEVALSLATTILIAILVVLRVPGAMLIGISVSSIISWASGLSPLPASFVELPSIDIFWPAFDWAGVVERWQDTLPTLLAFLFVCVFDTAGVQFGAGMQVGSCACVRAACMRASR
jgi:adenine/guanine/hypoxanthine permease